MSEKATGRPWTFNTPWAGFANILNKRQQVIFQVAMKPAPEEIEPLTPEDVETAWDFMGRAVNNYDQLASIAREMAGALQEASGIIGIDAAAPRVNHALSRYTAFMEGEE